MPSLPPARRVAWIFAVAALSGLFFVDLLRSDDNPVSKAAADLSASRPMSLPATLAIDPIIARIREEGLNRSKAPETIDYLCNVIGPRLTGSPNLRKAANWASDTLAGWGLSNAHLEEWGPFGRGWSLKQFSIQVVEPSTIVLNGFPKAWSTGFDQPLEAEVVYVDAKNEAGLAPYRGKLAGKIVLLGAVREPELPLTAPATRMDDDRLAKLAASRPVDLSTQPTPLSQPATATAGELLVPRAGLATAPTTGPGSQVQQLASSRLATRMLAFVAEESPALILSPSIKGDGGIYFVSAIALPTDPPPGSATGFGPSTRPRPWSVDAPKTPPQVVLGVEDFNRLVRIAKRNIPIKIRTDLQVQFHSDNLMVPNVVAEIPGGDLADEVIMVGAHLDSWHASTGATDNAIGSVAAMEAVRIIKALNLKPRRTIRVALWTGEEEGLLGSAAYVKAHFGHLDDVATTQPTQSIRSTQPTQSTSGPSSRPIRRTRRAATNVASSGLATAGLATAGSTTMPSSRPAATLVKGPDYEKLSAYFNLDNGTGKIRGIYCQGNEAAMPIFKDWLRSFADLGAQTVTLSNTGGTDHLSFDRIGLPGFQFIQDPMDYNLRTHHSNQDNFDRIQMDDLKQASTIMAAFIWNAANEPARFPRKILTATRPSEPRF